MRAILTVTILMACAGAWAQPPLGPYAIPASVEATTDTVAVTTDTIKSHLSASRASIVWEWDRDECVRGFRNILAAATNITTTNKTLIDVYLTSAPSTSWAGYWNAVPSTPGAVGALRNAVQRFMIRAAVRRLQIENTRMAAQLAENRKWQTLMWDYSTSASVKIP
jgi:hypothetical protein